MDLNTLFTTIDGLLGDMSEFLGLTFKLEHGLIIIDFVAGYEYPLEDGTVDIVDGYIIDFVPFDESYIPMTYFALDVEGIKYVISEFVLE